MVEKTSKKPQKSQEKQKKQEQVEKSSENISFNFNYDILKKLIPVFLILIVMFFAFYVRSGPSDLRGIDERVEENIYAQIRNVISQQVSIEYPNLDDSFREEIVEREYKKVLNTGVYELGSERVVISELAAIQAQTVKESFKYDNGQTYLSAIDPYYFYSRSNNYLKTGTLGNVLVDGVGYDTQRVAPTETKVGSSPEFHVWLMDKIYNFFGLNFESNMADKVRVIYWIPVILAMLSVIPIYLIIRYFSNDLFAAFGSLILVSIGTYVSRTVAGFVDTDGYVILFPLIISLFTILAFVYKRRVLTISFALIAGLFQGLFLWVWAPGWFIFVFLVASLLGYLGYLVVLSMVQKSKSIKDFSDALLNDFNVVASFVLSSYIFTWIFTTRDLFSLVYQGVVGSTSTLAGISQTTIWPNVLSSVAELSSASFNQILGSVGGKFVFLIAILGLLFMLLDYNSINKRDSNTKTGLYILTTIWIMMFVNSSIFTFLSINYKVIFISLMFLPLALALILGIIAGNRGAKVFLTILLTIWIAGGIFMSLNGVRFILILGPATSIAFAIGLYYIFNALNSYITKEKLVAFGSFSVSTLLLVIFTYLTVLFIEFQFGFSNVLLTISIAIIIAYKIYFIYKRLGDSIINYLNSKGFGFVGAVVLFTILFVPLASSAMLISKSSMPNFDDAWFDAMNNIKDDSNEDAIITSWWDFGHFFIAVAERGATFDGGSQATPQSHWVGKLFLENDEEVSHDILKMIVCSGNGAFDYALEITNDSTGGVKINKLLYSTFGKSIDEKRELIENYEYYDFSQEETDEFLDRLACSNPVENFLITSEDMVGKAPVWAHWGSWDFTKKYVHDNYRRKSTEQIANELDENVSLIEGYVQELEAIDQRANREDINREDLINQWFAPYPSYRGNGVCSEKEGGIYCGVGFNTQGQIFAVPYQGFDDCRQDANQNVFCAFKINDSGVDSLGMPIGNPFKNLFIPLADKSMSTTVLNESGFLDVILTRSSNGYSYMLADSPLGGSLFTKLFYLDGAGTEMFEKFDDKQSVTGVRVLTWKTLWEKQTVSNSSSLNLDDMDFEFEISQEELEELIN